MTPVKLLFSRCTVRRLCYLAESGALWHVAVALTRQMGIEYLLSTRSSEDLPLPGHDLHTVETYDEMAAPSKRGPGRRPSFSS